MMKKLISQIFKFGIVGGLAFVIDFTVLFVLTEYFHIYYLYSAAISFIVSLIFNYILSIKWVFDVEKKQTVKEAISFVILSTIGLGINQLMMYVSVEILSIYYIEAKIISTTLVMIYNFVTRKLLIEKQHATE